MSMEMLARLREMNEQIRQLRAAIEALRLEVDTLKAALNAGYRQAAGRDQRR
jgi:prefoldin subunit 5